MVTDLSFDDHVETIVPQAVSDFFVSISRSSLLKQICDGDHSQLFGHCGVYILIDQLLTKQNMKSFEIARKLLASCKVIITPPESIDALQFIEKIIDKAEAMTEHDSPPILWQSASQLKARMNDLLESYAPTLDAIEKFFASWQEFAQLLFQERLKS